MTSFKDLKTLICKCCRVLNKEGTIQERYGFKINFNAIEQKLQEVDPHMHVLSFVKEDSSSNIYLPDLQLLTEYLHTPEEISMVLDDCTEMYKFMIFSTLKGNGSEYTLKDSDGNPIAGEAIFNYINNFNEIENDDVKVNESCNIVKEIVGKLPVYNIVVLRIFDKRKDKFDYRIYFRSNYEMVGLYKAMNPREEE